MSKSDKKKSADEALATSAGAAALAAEPALADGAHEEFHCEPDNIPAGKVLLAIGIAVLVVTGLVTFITQVFRHMVETELQEKVYGYQSPELKELHVQEADKLTKYQWLDASHEGVRVPLDRARELALKAYREPAPAPTAAVTPSVTPSVTPPGDAVDTAAPEAGSAAPEAGTAAPEAGTAAPAAPTAAPEAPTK